MHTYRIISSDSGKEDILTEEDMEWVLNSLRLMQEHQQELAGQVSGRTLTKKDVLESLGAPVPEDEAEEVSVDVGAFVLGQHADVTTLRERLVNLVGHDLTDG